MPPQADAASAPTSSKRHWLMASGLWGFAEATLFFIVPDVLLTYLTLRRGWKAGLVAAAVALVGALVGGALMYAWGVRDPAGAEEALDVVPAIGGGLIASVQAGMAQDWVRALFTGAFSGVPYKIFAVEAGHAGIGSGLFLAVSILARYARFCAAIALTALAHRGLAWVGHERHATGILAAFWLCFYAAYFAVMAN
jgi:membrane protein YqaA with SNARE-associated domain